MKEYLEPAKSGFKKTLNLSFLLAKIIIPVTLAVTILEKTGLLHRVAEFFHPALGAFGLPGEAALPLLLGFFINIYAAMGAIAVLPLSGQEVTVIALIILTSHSLLMEAPVLSFTGLGPLRSIPMRIGLGLLFGFFLNIIYNVLGG